MKTNLDLFNSALETAKSIPQNATGHEIYVAAGEAFKNAGHFQEDWNPWLNHFVMLRNQFENWKSQVTPGQVAENARIAKAQADSAKSQTK